MEACILKCYPMQLKSEVMVLLVGFIQYACLLPKFPLKASEMKGNLKACHLSVPLFVTKHPYACRQKR